MGRRSSRTLPFLPTCGSPSKTLSFRATTTATISGDFDDMLSTGGVDDDESSVESVIRGLSTERFFFNPGETSSILEQAKHPKEEEKVLAFQENVSMMEMESTDPFVDFKKSMQEMVEADEGLKEWGNLQELLSLYLAVNDKINHGYIIGAFVDLLLVNLHDHSSSKPSSSIKGEDLSSVMKSGGGGSSSSSNTCNNNNSSNKLISNESPESGLSFTSSFASSSGTCSSTSHFLSTICSLENDDVEEDGDGDILGDDEDDNNSLKKAEVSD